VIRPSLFFGGRYGIKLVSIRIDATLAVRTATMPLVCTYPARWPYLYALAGRRLSMRAWRPLLLVPVVLAAFLALASLHFGATTARADGPGAPAVDEGLTVAAVDGFVGSSSLANHCSFFPTSCNTSTIFPQVCPPHCGQTWPWNYWYPYDWRNYRGSAWVYCTWPGGSGWILNGAQSSYMYCS
jgi:hypothetical protein